MDTPVSRKVHWMLIISGIAERLSEGTDKLGKFSSQKREENLCNIKFPLYNERIKIINPSDDITNYSHIRYSLLFSNTGVS